MQPISLSAFGLVGAFVLFGCSSGPPPIFRITFAATDGDEPLSNVSVSVNDQALGQTDGSGELRIDLSGAEGSAIGIDAACPAGHRTPTIARSITLRHLVGLTPEAAERGIVVNVTCLPNERLFALVVRADGQPNLPVVLRGREVARTDAAGVAHYALRERPSATFTVQLDTSANPDLQPQNPRRTFTVRDQNQYAFFDQRFEVRPPPPPPPRPGKRGPRAPAEAPRGPIRCLGDNCP